MSAFYIRCNIHFIIFSSALIITSSSNASEPISVIDYSNNVISLEKPARRIIALSPHAAENIFSAGAGQYLVGVVAYSNFPESVKTIDQVGSNNLLNFEAIINLQPDLIIAWQSGNTDSSLQRLKKLGFKLYLDEPQSLEDIAKSIQDIGVLAGTSGIATKTSINYLAKLKTLQREYSNKTKIKVFYEVWNQPLQTLNGQHLVSQAINLCAGENIYADLASLAPIINIESIIKLDPEVIIASGSSYHEPPSWLADWEYWPQLTAVKNNHLFFVPADNLVRHTIRILKGAETICSQLAQVRAEHSFE